MIGSAATFSERSSQPALVMDREAVVEPARDHRPRVELRAELDRDGDPSLVVHRVPVLAGEHLSGLPLRSCWPVVGGTWIPHFSPLCATSLHSSAQNGPVKADFAREVRPEPGDGRVECAAGPVRGIAA